MKYLIYFSLVPMIIHVLLMLILDEWGKTNIRVANNILVLHVSLVSTVVIALGLGMIVSFNGFAWTINLLGTECLTHYSQSTTTVSLFTNFTSKDRIPNFFFYFLAFLLVLQGLSILGILAINLLIRLYYRMR